MPVTLVFVSQYEDKNNIKWNTQSINSGKKCERINWIISKWLCVCISSIGLPSCFHCSCKSIMDSVAVRNQETSFIIFFISFVFRKATKNPFHFVHFHFFYRKCHPFSLIHSHTFVLVEHGWMRKKKETRTFIYLWNT
jgi:hypothetical protein